MVNVTQPFLPSLDEFIPYLEKIWASKILSNGGKFHQNLEEELCSYLGVEYISLFSNGTLGLITALQALDIKNEVITTPYSFVATSHSILWNGLIPVFVDIDPVSYNIDPTKIEASITEKTTAILAVHCYGNPCAVNEISKIANKYNLKVIYDAAHAFGVTEHGNSILKYGDLSVLSFHATKVFNTFEGGAIISNSKEMKTKIDHLKNFGFVDEITVVEAGINAKMSEINSAFGLLQLKYIKEVIGKRSLIDHIYRENLRGIKGIKCSPILTRNPNYTYFPIIVEKSFPLSRDELYTILKSKGINTRRYFYPLISDFPLYNKYVEDKYSSYPVARNISDSILCLPIYPDLAQEEQSMIIALIKELGRG
jgi:dTDP-4-amino-4,6-dideoxygalactose transaminase